MVKAKELVSLEFSILIDARYVAGEVTKQGHPRDLYRDTSCMHAHILPGLSESNYDYGKSVHVFQSKQLYITTHCFYT